MPKIFYSTPFALDKNIGKSYNEFCELMPPDSYIVLRDGDSMFLTPDFGKIIHSIIEEHGNQYDLIGCTTNRLRSNSQLHKGAFSNESNIIKHIEIAEDLKQYTEIRPTTEVAGLCMIFRKSLWERVKFRENSLAFDRQFSKDVLKIGGKIGIATGLYLFHSYRMGKEDPKNYVQHLL